MTDAQEAARNNPDIRAGIKDEILSAADALDGITGLLQGMGRFTDGLHFNGSGEEMFADVHSALFGLKEALDRHKHVRELADSETYLGNMAAWRAVQSQRDALSHSD